MVEILAAAMDTTNGNWLAWLIGGGVGTVTAPVVVWRIWSWLRKRASMSATIKIGDDVEKNLPMGSDPYSQEECDKKHAIITNQLTEIRDENRTMHVAMDDGFAKITSRLDTVNTRMDDVYRYLLENSTHTE